MRECSPPQTCHVLCVTCHVFLLLFFGQSGEAYRWRVCYQRGLPRLVSTTLGLQIFSEALPLLKTKADLQCVVNVQYSKDYIEHRYFILRREKKLAP